MEVAFHLPPNLDFPLPPFLHLHYVRRKPLRLLCISWAGGCPFLILAPVTGPQQPKGAKGLVACARWRQPLLHRAAILEQLEKGGLEWGSTGPPNGWRAGGTGIGSSPPVFLISGFKAVQHFKEEFGFLWLWHLCPAENSVPGGQRGALQTMGGGSHTHRSRFSILAGRPKSHSTFPPSPHCDWATSSLPRFQLC